ncbi:MAG: FtsX-like permease family protein, partial [Planctomycetes bacterium]|nr:FtsX-like permease family protein [Planctomycetota bacterium]
MSPLGQRLTRDQLDADGNLIWHEIVGVVGDIRHEEMSENIQPRFYLPYSQFAQTFMTIVARTTLEPGQTAKAIRGVVSEIDPEQPLVRYRLVGEVVEETMTIERLTTMLIGGFAGVALFLASIGLFGVMSFAVNQRVREIGIRMALGAKPTDVLVHFMKQGVILTLIGVAIGLLAAYGLTGLLSSQLYQVTPSDPMTFIVVPTVLTIVAM